MPNAKSAPGGVPARRLFTQCLRARYNCACVGATCDCHREEIVSQFKQNFKALKALKQGHSQIIRHVWWWERIWNLYILMKQWHFILAEAKLTQIFSHSPMVSYRKERLREKNAFVTIYRQSLRNKSNSYNSSQLLCVPSKTMWLKYNDYNNLKFEKIMNGKSDKLWLQSVLCLKIRYMLNNGWTLAR